MAVAIAAAVSFRLDNGRRNGGRSLLSFFQVSAERRVSMRIVYRCITATIYFSEKQRG